MKNKIIIIHKKRWFFTPISKIQQYIDLMQKKGYRLEFVDNNIFYWSENLKKEQHTESEEAHSIKELLKELGSKKEIDFKDWFDKNMIYDEDTFSFVHRLFNLKDNWKTYHDAQNDAFKIIEDMKKAYQEENEK